MTSKRWDFKPKVNHEDVEHLKNILNIEEVLAKLLVQRGIKDYDQAKSFFRPSLSSLYDPFLMKGMEKAIEKIDTVMTSHQPILIYGDYDVDGTTSVALLYSFWANFYDKLGFYIPDRYEEGYGLSMQAIEWAKEKGYKLIITLDCGITAVEPVKEALVQGIDVIITDHHRPGEVLPDAYAILNPKQEDCPYPFKELSGCGIGFKLAQAFCLKNNIELDNVYDYLDLLAVSIASDIVPIVDENRILCHFGLEKLGKNPSIGLKAIKDLCCDKDEITVSDIVFKIGPRINAAGRMGDAKNAVNLLINKDINDARNKADLINDTNNDRRGIDASITQEALDHIDNLTDFIDRKSTVVYGENWHKGVIGIVASRLIEQYHRPTIVFSKINGVMTGSARSVKGFDIYNALCECSEYVDQFGGHKYAAGLTLKTVNYEAFAEKFEEVVSESIKDHMLSPSIEIDSMLEFSAITPKFYNILKQFGPFGPKNMHPVFRSDQVYATNGAARVVGGSHLQVYVKQDDSVSLSAVGFGMADYCDEIAKGKSFNMVYTVEESIWKGEAKLKLNIKDIKF
jgi:single-stranded-DNA-specific exonuclease